MVECCRTCNDRVKRNDELTLSSTYYYYYYSLLHHTSQKKAITKGEGEKPGWECAWVCACAWVCVCVCASAYAYVWVHLYAR